VKFGCGKAIVIFEISALEDQLKVYQNFPFQKPIRKETIETKTVGQTKKGKIKVTEFKIKLNFLLPLRD